MRCRGGSRGRVQGVRAGRVNLELLGGFGNMLPPGYFVGFSGESKQPRRGRQAIEARRVVVFTRLKLIVPMICRIIDIDS